MRPTFGTNIPYATFNTKELVAEITKQELFSSFAKFLPSLTLQEVKVTVSEDSYVYADVSYTLPNQEEMTMTVGLAYLSGSTPIYEEFL
jgi:hypothetical protein